MFTAFAALSVTKIGKPNANTVNEQNHEYQRFLLYVMKGFNSLISGPTH